MITSTSNQQVKYLVQLKKKARFRREERCFLTEGLRMFQETPRKRIRQVYVTESFAKDHRESLKGLSVEIFSDQVFSYVSDTKTPQGVLCVVSMEECRPETMLADPNGMWLLLENIQDPGNLGTMFRTGEGAGVAGVIMDSSTVDIYNPKVIRSTMGAIYRVPFLITDDLPGMIRQMQAKKISVYAAYLKGSVCYDEPDYCQASAFLIGNEGNGLKEETAALADRCIRIPMEGQLESLNAAMAAGILMYEGSRQRRRG